MVLSCVKKNEYLGLEVFISQWSLKECQDDLNIGVVFNFQQRKCFAVCQLYLLFPFLFVATANSGVTVQSLANVNFSVFKIH